MKMYHCKQTPSVITYRKFKNFSNIEFMKDLEEHLTKFEHFNNIPSHLFKETVNTILEKHAPTKKKYVRANQAPFITKTLSKEIMKRSRLRNKFLNTKSDIDRKVYNKQRNYVVSLLRKEKKEFYGNLDISKVTDNRVFWKIVKSKISDKVKIRSKVTLVEDDKILSQDAEIAKTFNEYFINIPILNMPNNQSFSTQTRSLEENTISGIIERYKDHPSINLIKSKNSCLANTCSFTPVSIEEVKRAIESLDPKKAAQEKDIHTNILKQNSDFFAFHVQKDINASISTSKFPNDLKEANVIPVYKKKSKLSKENYRPISILPNFSKVDERCLYDQISKYFETRFSKFQCGFRKGYSAQHCLLAIIEKWKTAVDNGGVFAALLTDLSKAFDCIPHDLIIAKPAAYGFDTNALRLIHNYLYKRKQRVKINSVYSIWKDISYGVPQGSILGPLLFNIHLCDLFYFLENTDIASYADDNTLYSAQKNRETVINTIEASSQVLFDWFSDNFMKANSGKSHLLMSGTETTHANADRSMIKSSQKEILLGINLDSELKFEDHVNFMCKKASQKLYALARIAPFMDLKQRRNITEAFVESQFGYCPLIWMFHSRGLNNKINRIHERALRITFFFFLIGIHSMQD